MGWGQEKSHPLLSWPQCTTFGHWTWNMNMNLEDPDLKTCDTGWVTRTRSQMIYSWTEFYFVSFGTKSFEKWSSNDNVEKIFPAQSLRNLSKRKNSFKRKQGRDLDWIWTGAWQQSKSFRLRGDDKESGINISSVQKLGFWTPGSRMFGLIYVPNLFASFCVSISIWKLYCQACSRGIFWNHEELSI